MLRLSVGSVAILALLVGGLLAADNKANPAKTEHNAKGEKAKIVNVNPKANTVTLEMKNKEGKEVKRTFHLTEDVRMIDESTGRAAALDVFRSGDEVLVMEAQGKLKELHRHPHSEKGTTSSKENNKKK
jgi:uncharacterized protein YigE (DUF2233 family)